MPLKILFLLTRKLVVVTEYFHESPGDVDDILDKVDRSSNARQGEIARPW
jgi:hypothetical protein